MTDPQTIVNLGTGGTGLNAQNGSTTSADSNDARFLDWPGDNAGHYVYLSGVNDNFLSVPDEAALDITGDIDIRVQVAMDDWTPAAISGLVSKWLTTGNQRSYSFQLLTTAILRFVWSANGTAEISKDSTVAVSVNDYAVKWVRVTLDVDNGASGNDVKFFTSDDGTTWTQLGSTVTTASTTSIYSSTATVSVGQVQASTNMSAGKFYRAQVLNGIGGTTVLDVDTSRITSGSNTSFTAVTGQTVTITRSSSGRRSVAVVSPVWLFGTDDFMQVANNALLDIGANDNFTVIAVARVWGTAAFTPLVSKGTGQLNFVGYLWRTAAATPNSMQAVIGEGSGFGTSYNSPDFTFGNGFVGTLVADRQAATLARYLDKAVTSGAASFGSLVTTSLFTIGRQSAPSPTYANSEIFAVAFFRRALSAAEVSQIVDYYANKAA